MTTISNCLIKFYQEYHSPLGGYQYKEKMLLQISHNVGMDVYLSFE